METPPVLLIDDGELDEVRGLLEDLAVDFLHVRGPSVPDEVEEPACLLVTTAGRALTLQLMQPDEPSGKPMRVAFVTGDSKTQRNLLRRAGFEFLVHSPAHPAAVRLLFLRALYRGREKRGATRLALGYEVNYRTGLRKKKATLLELSDSGCRLLTTQALDRGTRLTLHIPRSVTRGKPIDIPGRAVRVIRGKKDGDSQDFAVAVRFEDLSSDLDIRLNHFLETHASGPTALPAGEASAHITIAPKTPTIPDMKVHLGSAEEIEELGPEEEPIEEPLPEPTAPPRSASPDWIEDADPDAEWEMLENVCEEPPQLELEGDDGNRREHPRVAYESEVIAMFRDATRVLVGQDISQGGMRVEPNENLKAGDYLRLGIYGKADQDPLLVEALVVRNDGPRGVALPPPPVASTS
jgi:hypothetical protein